MLLTVDGRVMLLRAAHLRNARSPMELRFAGRVTLSSLEHDWKAE